MSNQQEQPSLSLVSLLACSAAKSSPAKPAQLAQTETRAWKRRSLGVDIAMAEGMRVLV